jgi:hypothetical protein
MRQIVIARILIASLASSALAQAPTMKQLMLDLIHPASNEILLTVNRGGPSDDKEWTSVRRSALALAESGSLLITQGPTASAAWADNARLLAEAGMDAWKAAQAKDTKALTAVTSRIDAACTSCHRQFRPNVFPRQEGGSR